MRQFFSNHKVKFEDHIDVDLEQNTFWFYRSDIGGDRDILSNDNEFMELYIIISG